MPRTRFTPATPIYTVRVRLPGFVDEDGRKVDDVWREIEVAGNQTLKDLGEAIPLAFDFTDPHLWSFFLSGKAWDRSTEYALLSDPDLLGGGRPRLASRIRIRDVPFPGKTGRKEFLFLFDYGDEWHFRVKLVRTSDTVDPEAAYPRVVASQGEAPPQYPEYDEYEEDEEENAADEAD